jgi:phospholipid/cholesterol/gamma-HCH transport system ATP-binding protein
MDEKKSAVRICVKQVTKTFAKKAVLQNLSFTVQPGEIFIIMGPSGTGKSVLLKLLSGLDQPTSGEIYINDLPLKQVKKSNRYVLGLVFQAGALFNSLSIFDNLALYFREHQICKEAEIEKRITHVLNLLGLKGIEKQMPSSLSGGMKKRVALARGLLMEPDILLFDEPTSELDLLTASSIIELIGYVNRHLGITTVVSSHDILLAKTIGHHIGVLQNGTMDTIYTPETLFQSNNAFIKNFLNPRVNLERPQFPSFLV